MKRNVALLVAAVCMLLAASAQAANLSIEFWTKTKDGVKPAQDVHYTVMDLNSNTVADVKDVQPTGVVANLDVEPGVYYVSAEQPSTRYFGSMTLSVNATAPKNEVYSQEAGAEAAGEATNEDEDNRRFFLLSDEGLNEISEAQLQQLQASGVPSNTVAPQPTYAQQPVYQYPVSETPQRRWGFWIGAGALATAIVACFLPENKPDGPSESMDTH